MKKGVTNPDLVSLTISIWSCSHSLPTSTDFLQLDKISFPTSVLENSTANKIIAKL
jgi:hypothetical protein